MAFDYINEAFKRLDFLNEDMFDISLDGRQDLANFMERDDSTVRVIDPEATTEEDLLDSYIGKVICRCNICNSHIFKEKEDIEISDEGVVNAEDSCPYCGEEDGFTVVGEIAPYTDKSSSIEDSEETEEETVETDKSSNDDTAVLEESLDVGSNGRIVFEDHGLTLVGTKGTTSGRYQVFKHGMFQGNITAQSDEEAITKMKSGSFDQDESMLTEETVYTSRMLKDPKFNLTSGQLAMVKQAVKAFAGDDKVVSVAELGNALKMSSKLQNMPKETLAAAMSYLIVNPNLELTAEEAAEIEGEQGEKNESVTISEALADRPFEQWLYKMDDTKQPKKYFSMKNFEDYLWDTIDLISNQARVSARAEAIAESKNLKAFMNNSESPKILTDPKHPKYKTALAAADIIGWAIMDVLAPTTRKREIASVGKDGRIRGNDEFAVGGVAAAKATVDRYNSDSSKRESLDEDFKEVSITTEDQHLEMTSDENGKVTVTTEPVANDVAEGEETISPVSAETQEEILADNGVEEPVEEINTEDLPEDETTDEEIPIEDVDDDSLNGVTESYLKEVYDNVASFRATNVSSTPTKMIVEGVIKFTSGIKKRTGFIFEAFDAKQNGKVRFKGMNEHLSKDAEAFTLVGCVDNKKLFTESLKYNYSVGEGKVIRGIARRK